jgi:TMEM175 potassium channel family protein
MAHKAAAPPRRRFVNLERLVALDDGVFAIALTLLALDLRLPEGSTGGLATGLGQLAPKLLAFLLAFLVIGSQWDARQRSMLHVEAGDGTFVWLTLLSLMFVTLLPASTAVLGRYPREPLALACFGANSSLLGLTNWLAWRRASQGRRLLDAEAAPALVRLVSRLWLVNPLLVAATIPLAFVSVYPVYVLWALLPVASYLAIGQYLSRSERRGPREKAVSR